jgi:cell division protein FtsB
MTDMTMRDVETDQEMLQASERQNSKLRKENMQLTGECDALRGAIEEGLVAPQPFTKSSSRRCSRRWARS